MYLQSVLEQVGAREKALLLVLLHRAQLGELVGSELFHSCQSGRSRGRKEWSHPFCLQLLLVLKVKVKSVSELRFCSKSLLEDLLFVCLSNLFLLSLGVFF